MTDHHCHHPSEPKRAFKPPDDRLSALPDDILLYILLFFRTRDAARTSVLSTRWRYLFVRLPDVDPTFSEAYKCNFMDKRPTLCCHARNKRDMLLCKSIKFINFANRVMMLRKGDPIRKVKLVLKPVIPNISVAIDSIFAALSCKLQELDIFIGSDENWNSSCAAIFSCRTLVTLKVTNSEVDLVLPDSVYLPQLKVLHLLELAPVDAGSISRFMKACPLLEELKLTLRSSNLIEHRAVDLSSPSLRKLILSGFLDLCSLVIKSESLDYLEYSACQRQKFSLNAPNLKYFIYNSYDSINFVQNLKSLVEAKIKLRFDGLASDLLSLNDLHALVKSLQSVQLLDLHHPSLPDFYRARDLLPTFNNLTTLLLEAFHDEHVYHASFWKVLLCLLQNAPKLEVLIFDQVRKNFRSTNGFECIFSEAIPTCFIQHLREIEIRNFNGTVHELKVVEYFLENGISLKKMTLCRVTNPFKFSSKVCKRILSFSKCSADCQIVFK